MTSTALTESEQLRIFRMIDQTADCWEWIGTRMSTGYGQVWLRGRMHQAYRVLWEHFHGPIPDGLEIDHLCRNRWCVNPAHLEPVTHRENLLRRGIHTVCARGHLKDERNVFDNGKGHRLCRTCRNATRAKNRTRRKALGLPKQ